MELEGTVALVTGASRRVGKEIARSLAAHGASVAVHYRSSREAAERTASELSGVGPEAWPVRADLARAEEVESLIDRVAERFGRLDLLVNSAASFESQPFDTIDAAAWDEVMAVNLRAPFLAIRRAAPLLGRSYAENGTPGAVVNIIDLSAWTPWSDLAHHSVSKAGLLQLTRAAALELAPAVRVNALAPGAILPTPEVDPESEAWRERARTIPAGRTGRPDEVGSAVVFLAQNDFVTGAALTVDGGELLRRGGD